MLEISVSDPSIMRYSEPKVQVIECQNLRDYETTFIKIEIRSNTISLKQSKYNVFLKNNKKSIAYKTVNNLMTVSNMRPNGGSC